jgi:bifunctional DNA-binding transcriptional regulator/antitoxin component of YhaV-PrlF toxin-antitoxin module
LRTFDCWVVFIDEVTLDELDCEAALSHSSAPYYHQLVFPEELRHLLALAAGQWVCVCDRRGRHLLWKPLRRSRRSLQEWRNAVAEREARCSRESRPGEARSRRGGKGWLLVVMGAGADGYAKCSDREEASRRLPFHGWPGVRRARVNDGRTTAAQPAGVGRRAAVGCTFARNAAREFALDGMAGGVREEGGKARMQMICERAGGDSGTQVAPRHHAKQSATHCPCTVSCALAQTRRPSSASSTPVSTRFVL